MRFVEVIDFDQLPCQQKGKSFLFINEAVFSDERCGLWTIVYRNTLFSNLSTYCIRCGDLVLGVQRFKNSFRKHAHAINSDISRL